MNVLLENMTSREIRELLDDGWGSVIITSGSTEQHGAHLPINTDYILAKEIAVRTAQKIGKTLVAPVLQVGCSEHHMSFPGTITIEPDELMNNIVKMGEAFIQHGFKQILMTAFHGGNFVPTKKAAEVLRSKFPDVDIRAALDLHEVAALETAIVKENVPDRKGVEMHASCAETSMMLHIDPNYLREEYIQDGAVIDEIPAGISRTEDVSPNGIIGEVRGYSAELGEKLIDGLVNCLILSWELL